MNPWLIILNKDREPICPKCGEECQITADDGIHPEAWCHVCDIDILEVYPLEVI